MADTTVAERSARYRQGLAQQVREIRFELAAIRKELDNKLPALTALLAADERPPEHLQ
jgi:hypothetical protein